MYQTPLTSPSKLQTPTTPTSETTSWTPRGLTPSLQPSTHPPQTSPTRTSSAATAIPTHKAAPIDPISALPPTQLHLLRSSFQLLDHDNDGLLTRPDISTTLKNLGQPSDPSSLLPFFPPGAPQSVPLPSYLTTLSTLLAPLSSTPELLNAFAAFDDHDTGELDVGELRDAVLHTAPEAGGRGLSEGEVEEALRGFVGKRAFGREMAKGGGGRGEVFRYREWVGGVMGGGEEKGEGEK